MPSPRSRTHSLALCALLSSGPALAADDPLRLEDHHPLSYALALKVDPAAGRLSGQATLRLSLDHSARNIWLNAEELDITGASLRVLEGSSSGRTLPVQVQEGAPERVGFTWGEALRGEVELRVDYSAPISTVDTSGAFSQREGEDTYVFTQLEPLDARRVFPCFDQPEYKTPFQLTLTVPEGLGAWSNAPVASEAPSEAGWRRVVFAETRPLPTYLVALAVGPFDVVETGRWGRRQVPVNILTPRGRAADAAFAAEVTGPLLEDLERWFDLDYPFEKLDVVSLPKPVGWGAMENAGLITMEQGMVISRPEDDSPARQRDYAEVMAHELAHHWFGDLVTPAWWDDLWLNESFATFLSLEILERRWPEWKAEVTRVAWQGGAMEADSLRSARRVREPIRVVDDIEGAFDSITYQKGSAILTMVQGWLGEEVFRRGVHRFLAAHAYGSATADDFVDALSAEAGRDLSKIFDGLLEQPGLPEIMASCKEAVTPELILSQARWLPDGPERARWDLPVCVRYPAAEGEQRACTLMSGRRGRLELPGAQGCPSSLVLNDGQRGYYRVRYSEPAITTLLAGDSALSTAERVGVLQDAAAAVSRAEIAPGALLEQLPGLLALNERRVTRATLGVASALDAHLVPPELRQNYERFLRETYGALATELGLSGAPDEDEETRLLRPELLSVVGLTGRDPVWAERARPLAEQWLSTREGVDPEMVPVVLSLAASEPSLAWFERLRDQLLAEPDRSRREALYRALGGQRDPAMVQPTLDWVTSGDLDIREAFPVVLGFLEREDTARAQWVWYTQNTERLESLIPAVARPYLVYLGLGFCSEEGRAEVERSFAPRVGRWVGGKRALEQGLEQIEICTESRLRQEAGVRSFLLGWPAPDVSAPD